MKTNIPFARTTNLNTLAARLRTACATRLPLLLLLLTLPVVAKADNTYGDYTYTVHNNKATITGYNGDGGNITVPGWMIFYGVLYYPVTTIGTNAFNSQTSLTGVTLPNSVTSIGFHAFFGCASMTNIALPNSVTSMGDWVFEQCFSLASVTIPGSVTNIGVGMFYNCWDLTSVTIPNSITSISDSMFGECYALNNVSIPNGVTSIGNFSFSDCSALTSITIPNSVTNIRSSAFSGDNVLTSITIPGSVTSIGNSAFDSCSSLVGVYFMSNAPSLDSPSTVFGNCPDVTAYYLSGTTGWDDFSDATGVPIALWNLPVTLDFGFVGVGTNQFGFSFSAGNLTGTSNLVVVVEARTDLGNSSWTPLVTNTLTSTSSSSYFSDPKWTNYPSRIYRLRSQ